MTGLAAVIPLAEIERAAIYVNEGRRSMASVRTLLGCDDILNAGFFNMSAFKPVNWLVAGGKTLSTGGSPYGYGLDGGRIVWSYENEAGCPDFIGAYPLLVMEGKRAFDAVPAGLGGDRGRSAMGLTPDSLVLRCVPDASGASDYTLHELARDMLDLGCLSAINLDGGGSSQCDFGGQRVVSGRVVHNFVCLWHKKEGDDILSTYVNGSARRPVYETTECKKQIGSLDPFEACALLYRDAGFDVVMYRITGTAERKVGFIRT